MQEEMIFRENQDMSLLTDGNPKTCKLYKPWLDEDDASNVLF
jgi:hypothetical protein